MNRQEVVDWIKNSKSKFFRIEFKKRSDGSLRSMLCQFGVKAHIKGGSGTGPAYNAISKNLITVWEKEADSYKTIPIEGILRIMINGIWLTVD